MPSSKHTKWVHRRWAFLQMKTAVSDFWKKDTKAKIHTLRGFLFQIIIVSSLAWAPLGIMWYNGVVERDRNQVILDNMPIEKKWLSVSKGAAKLECDDDLSEKLKEADINPSSTKAMDYAIEHGFCVFVAVVKDSHMKEPCSSFVRLVHGDWISPDCMYESNTQ